MAEFIVIVSLYVHRYLVLHNVLSLTEKLPPCVPQISDTEVRKPAFFFFTLDIHPIVLFLAWVSSTLFHEPETKKKYWCKKMLLTIQTESQCVHFHITTDSLQQFTAAVSLYDAVHQNNSHATGSCHSLKTRSTHTPPELKRLATPSISVDLWPDQWWSCDCATQRSRWLVKTAVLMRDNVVTY